MKRHVILVIALGLVLAACGRATQTPLQPQNAAPGPDTERDPAPGESPTDTPAPQAPTGDTANQALDVARLAQQDLARQLNIAPEEIELISVEAVDWSDSSLGCPQPGSAYADVITPGFRILLEAGGETYEYHSDLDDRVINCKATVGGPFVSPPAASPARPALEVPAQAQEPVELARQDVAERLNVASQAVRVASVEAVEWPDSSLGCPQPGMMYAQVITPGFLVVLEAGGKTYEYHTDQDGHIILCENEDSSGG